MVHRSHFGGSSSVWNNTTFETAKKGSSWGTHPALRAWSSSPGRLSVVQLLNTDNCSWPAVKGFQALHFQISYLQKCLSAFIFQERKKNCIRKLWKKCYNYFCSRNNFQHFKFLGCGDLFHVHVSIFKFFIGLCNRGSITQSCKNPNRTETLYIWFMSYGLNIHTPAKG